MTTFNTKYSSLMSYPVFNKYFENSDYYNVGLWDKSIDSQKKACENLVQYLLQKHSGNKNTLLDVGCGKGSVCNFIETNNWCKEITGINISEEQIDFCKKLNKNCTFETMDACNMNFKNDSFDTIISIEAALHFPSRSQFLKKAYEILRPNGTIAIADFLFEKTLNKGIQWMTPDSNNITSAEYLTLFEKTGFKEIILENVTDKTWIPYLKNLKTWINSSFMSNNLSKNEIISALDIYKKAKEFPVKEIIIISGKK